MTYKKLIISGSIVKVFRVNGDIYPDSVKKYLKKLDGMEGWSLEAADEDEFMEYYLGVYGKPSIKTKAEEAARFALVIMSDYIDTRSFELFDDFENSRKVLVKKGIKFFQSKVVDKVWVPLID